MTRFKPWTVTQLYREMQEDLSACNDSFERCNVKAICGKEIREFAESLDRKLTPGELAIAQRFGYKGN